MDMVQMIGIFAFQADKRILGGPLPAPAARAGLHPRPRTVDGYLRDGCSRFRTIDVRGAI